jgi:hypothetical protein
MMIRGTKIAFLAVIALTLYWLIASWGVRQGVSAWFAEQQRQGWQAEFANLETTGFPLELRNRITAPVLADPGTGTAWRAEWLELISPAIWPGDLTLAFPSTPQRVSYLDQTVVLQAEALEASLQLAPGLALQLEHLGVSSAAWQLDLDKTPWLEGHALDLEMRQQGDPASYAITAEASGVLPSAVLRQQLAAADGLPQRLDTVAVDMDVQFDTAWDRKALELRRPQPRNIALHLAEARWGPMRIKATGGLRIDETGVAEGDIALQIENWQDILHMAEAAQLLGPQTRAGVERVLRVFAGLGGNHRDLDLPLTFKSGYVALGPLPIGPAPRLVLR